MHILCIVPDNMCLRGLRGYRELDSLSSCNMPHSLPIIVSASHRKLSNMRRAQHLSESKGFLTLVTVIKHVFDQ